MRRARVLRAFTEDGAGGGPVAVVPEGGKPDADAPLVVHVSAEASDRPVPVRFTAPGGALPLSGAGLLAAAAALADEGHPTPLRFATAAGAVTATRHDDTWWLDLTPAAFFNWAQPAFAARSVCLDPLRLDSRHMPGAVGVGVPYLVVPVETAADVERARFELHRLRELLPRVGADAALVFTDAPDGSLRMRAFADAYGLPEDAAAGEAAGALAAWRLDNAPAACRAVDAEVRAGARDGRPFRVRVEARRLDAGGVVVRVGGRVTE